MKLLWLAALWPLAGCLAETGLTRMSGAKPDTTAVRQFALYGGDVVVQGPRGYCVDTTSLRRQPSNRLVLMGSCESLTGQAGISVRPALIVVNVGTRQPGRAQPTAAAIAAGVAPKKPLDMIDSNGIALVHLDAGGNLALPGGDPRYWRAGMVLNDHLVSLAIYGPKGSPLAGSAGKSLIMDLAKAMRAASATRPAPPAKAAQNQQPPAQQASASAPSATQANPKRENSGLLSLLFPKSG